MSERTTNMTQDLILTNLPLLFDGSSDDRWQAAMEFTAKSWELSQNGLVDDGILREIAVSNAERLRLDFDAADAIFGIRQKPSGGSLAAMHSPSRSVWKGTGSSASIVGSELVHYINKPGIVEKIYGPAFPYVMDKLGWMAVTSELKGIRLLSNSGGYQYVTNRLRRFGRAGAPHIGPAVVYRDNLYRPDPELPDKVISSASGTLVEDWVDATYQRIPEYADRAVADEAAGLFDGHIENRRAGLYDTFFSEMVGRALLKDWLRDQMLEVFDAKYFEGVDIN